MANQVTTAEAKPQTPMQRFNSAISSESMKDYLSSMLGDKRDSFVNNVVALVSNSTALQACKPMSVIYAAMKATALDLPLDPALGFAYVIPYGNASGAAAQFQIGKAGLIQLAMRSGQVSKLNAGTCYEGDIVDEDFLTGDITVKKGEKRNKKKIIGFFAYLETTTFKKTLYMTKEEMDAHGTRFSKTFKSGPWQTDYEAMAHKTILKKILKWAPMSVEMRDAVKADQAEITQDGKYVYVDRPEDVDEQNFEENAQAVNERREAMRASGEMADTLL